MFQLSTGAQTLNQRASSAARYDNRSIAPALRMSARVRTQMGNRRWQPATTMKDAAALGSCRVRPTEQVRLRRNRRYFRPVTTQRQSRATQLSRPSLPPASSVRTIPSVQTPEQTTDRASRPKPTDQRTSSSPTATSQTPSATTPTAPVDSIARSRFGRLWRPNPKYYTCDKGECTILLVRNKLKRLRCLPLIRSCRPATTAPIVGEAAAR